MRITKVKYYDVDMSSNSRYLGKCSVVLDDSLILHDIRIFDGDKGRYVIMPTKSTNKECFKSKSNEGDDVFHPVKKSFFYTLSKCILKGYENMLKTGEPVYHPK